MDESVEGIKLMEERAGSIDKCVGGGRLGVHIKSEYLGGNIVGLVIGVTSKYLRQKAMCGSSWRPD